MTECFWIGKAAHGWPKSLMVPWGPVSRANNRETSVCRCGLWKKHSASNSHCRRFVHMYECVYDSAELLGGLFSFPEKWIYTCGPCRSASVHLGCDMISEQPEGNMMCLQTPEFGAFFRQNNNFKSSFRGSHAEDFSRHVAWKRATEGCFVLISSQANFGFSLYLLCTLYIYSREQRVTQVRENKDFL